MLDNSICVFDLCGGGRSEKYGYVYPVSMSADYYPDEHVTKFTGLWWHVPDLETDVEPTEEQVEAHAAKFGGWEQGYQNYLDAERRETEVVKSSSLTMVKS